MEILVAIITTNLFLGGGRWAKLNYFVSTFWSLLRGENESKLLLFSKSIHSKE